MGKTKATLTIVGGQPNRLNNPVAEVTNIPQGIENLLHQAAQDRSFRSQLLSDRKETLQSTALDLTPMEIATLSSISDTMLEKMIDALAPTI